MDRGASAVLMKKKKMLPRTMNNSKIVQKKALPNIQPRSTTSNMKRDTEDIKLSYLKHNQKYLSKRINNHREQAMFVTSKLF